MKAKIPTSPSPEELVLLSSSSACREGQSKDTCMQQIGLFLHVDLYC